MGFETLRNIIEENKRLAELNKEEANDPTMCPDCWWELDVNSKGEKSCPICGRIFKGGRWQ